MEPFTPPLPLILCLAAAAAAVVASFVVVAFFAGNRRGYLEYPRVNLLQWSLVRRLNRSGVAALFTQVASVFLFVMVISAGFFGNSNPIYNLAPTFVWVVWWVGVAYASAFLGDIWALLNPWKILFGWMEQVWLRLNSGRGLAPVLRYPAKAGVWPGLLLFLIFAWIENVYVDAIMPSRISQMILLYSVITWTGMALYGKGNWLRHGEVFSLVFGFLARFAPVQTRLSHSDCGDGDTKDWSGGYTCDESVETRRGDCLSTEKKLFLQPFASALLDREKISISQTLFVLFLLAAVTFDGFTGTLPWLKIQNYVVEYIPNITFINTLGLLAAVVIFGGVYFVFAALMNSSSKSTFTTLEIANAFVFTLIPIALAYHVAHFLLFLLVQGQMMVPLVSDPFGFDWNLFNTANYRVNFMIVSSNVYWLTSVVAILLGHIIAVFLSHSVALRLIRSQKAAMRSQYPMLFLMVGYTVASLWIITQPMYS